MIKVLTLLTLAAAGAAVQAQSVYFEGRELSFEDRPYVARGTTMVPAREMGDRIGASLQRDDRGSRIWWNYRNNRATYNKGDRTYDLNGRNTSLPAASETRRDVLFVPIQIFQGLTDGRVSQRRDDWSSRPGMPGQRRDDNWDRRDDSWDRRDDRRDDRWDRNDDYNNNRYGRDTVTFERRELRFDRDAEPYRKGGTLMVPFRALGDAIGARTERTEDGLRIWIYYNGDRVEYNKGHTWYRLNSTQKNLSTVSEDRSGVLFVPIQMFEDITRGKVRAG